MTDGGYDFPVVSDGGSEELASARPGTTLIVDETVYAASDPETGFDRGDRVGTLTIVQWKGSGHGVPFVAYFLFDDDESVTLTGFAPGNGTWKGARMIAYSGGTGKFASRTGELPLESDNPKRWG